MSVKALFLRLNVTTFLRQLILYLLLQTYWTSTWNFCLKNTERFVREDEIIYEELANPKDSKGDVSFESYMLKIPANTHTHRGSYGHMGQEFGIIIKGRAKLIYEDREYILEEGDSVSYSAAVPHTVENIGDCELNAIWVLSPAQRFTGK